MSDAMAIEAPALIEPAAGNGRRPAGGTGPTAGSAT